MNTGGLSKITSREMEAIYERTRELAERAALEGEQAASEVAAPFIYEPAASQRSGHRRLWVPESSANICRRPHSPMAWDVAPILPAEDAPALLFGPPGGLKSFIALHLAACVVSGQKFLGHYAVAQRPSAIYVNLDAGARSFARRIQRLGIDEERLLIVSQSNWNAREFRDLAAAYPGAFVVIDCWADIYRPGRDDPAEAMRRSIRDLRCVFEEFGLGGVILDHPHRPREGVFDYFGSVQKEATNRTMWRIEPFGPPDDVIKRARISCRKLSEGDRFPEFVVSVHFGDTVTFSIDTGKLTSPVKQTDEDLVVWALAGSPQPMSSAEIGLSAQISERRVLAAVKDTRIQVSGRGRGTRYRLANRAGALHVVGSETQCNDSPDAEEVIWPE